MASLDAPGALFHRCPSNLTVFSLRNVWRFPLLLPSFFPDRHPSEREAHSPPTQAPMRPRAQANSRCSCPLLHRAPVAIPGTMRTGVYPGAGGRPIVPGGVPAPLHTGVIIWPSSSPPPRLTHLCS